MNNTIVSLPKQKLSYKEKTQDWAKENVKAGIMLSDYNPGKMRKSKHEMDLNYRLISGDFDQKDVEHSLNPLGLKGMNWPARIQNYPIELTKLDVLKGEELSRSFNWFLRATNDHVAIIKDEKQTAELKNYLASQLDNPNYSDAVTKQDLQKMKKYYNYDYLDEREEMGTRLLQHIWKTQNVPSITTDAFYDIVTVAEEMYACDILHGEPVNRKVKPKNLSVFGNGENTFIDDAMIIVEDSYMSASSLQDMFFDELSDEEVKKLDDGIIKNRLGGNIVFSGPVNIQDEYMMSMGSQLVPMTSGGNFAYGGGWDDEGNVRLSRVIWTSKVKVGYLSYYEEGEEMHNYVSEDYVINKTLGEKIEWQWLKEYWQGYCIGGPEDGIFLKMERLPRLGMTFNNPSKTMSPYVGTIYTIGDKAYSLVDRIRPYKYLYNITMTRAELASARNKGILAEMDLARIPQGWTPELWMTYAELNGFFVTDSFKAGNEGPALGKLLSNLNNRAPSTMNLDASQVIMSNLEFSRFIKNEINEITGITPQREGMISNRETLGGVNRSLEQSSFITEPYFYVHDNTKLRLLTLNLETAKYCYREKKFNLSMMDDGLINKVLNVDGPMLSETSYGLSMSNSKEDTELFAMIKQYAQAALQNDKAKFKDIFDIMRTKSIAGVGKQLEAAEDALQSERAVEAQKQQEGQQSQIEAQIKWDQLKFEQESKMRMREIDNMIILKEMDLNAIKYKTDQVSEIDRKQIEADIQIAKDKNMIELEKLKAANAKFNRELAEERTRFSQELALKKTKKMAS